MNAKIVREVVVMLAESEDLWRSILNAHPHPLWRRVRIAAVECATTAD